MIFAFGIKALRHIEMERLCGFRFNSALYKIQNFCNKL